MKKMFKIIFFFPNNTHRKLFM